MSGRKESMKIVRDYVEGNERGFYLITFLNLGGFLQLA